MSKTLALNSKLYNDNDTTKNFISNSTMTMTQLTSSILLYGVGGIMVSIAAFQAVDPGSIPGRRNF